ncbi:MAG: hypothetical protein M5T61_08855 [Acidimicrobiia bacterium]|nr:hypothetical protein [Acidimicrobiia bacterium]
MWGVEVLAEPVDMAATSAAIYATQTQAVIMTATAIAPYITPSPGDRDAHADRPALSARKGL